MEIHKRILDAMADIEAIPKDRKNASQGYNFRGADDVYASLHGVLSKHRIYTIPEVVEDRTEERVTKGGSPLIYRLMRIRYHFTTDDGSEVIATVIGEGMDSGDKAGNKAMSVAHKYALLQVFAIPTSDPKDPEVDSPEPAPRLTPASGHDTAPPHGEYDRMRERFVEMVKSEHDGVPNFDEEARKDFRFRLATADKARETSAMARLIAEASARLPVGEVPKELW